MNMDQSDASQKEQEQQLTSFSKYTQTRVIALGNYFKQYYTHIFEYVMSRQQRYYLLTYTAHPLDR